MLNNIVALNNKTGPSFLELNGAKARFNFLKR